MTGDPAWRGRHKSDPRPHFPSNSSVSPCSSSQLLRKGDSEVFSYYLVFWFDLKNEKVKNKKKLKNTSFQVIHKISRNSSGITKVGVISPLSKHLLHFFLFLIPEGCRILSRRVHFFSSAMILSSSSRESTSTSRGLEPLCGPTMPAASS